jgi:hypothetical protein
MASRKNKKEGGDRDVYGMSHEKYMRVCAATPGFQPVPICR